jgi:hypothetical protein
LNARDEDEDAAAATSFMSEVWVWWRAPFSW